MKNDKEEDVIFCKGSAIHKLIVEEVVVMCPRCKGTGITSYVASRSSLSGPSKPYVSESTCHRCDGFGKIRVPISTLNLEKP